MPSLKILPKKKYVSDFFKRLKIARKSMFKCIHKIKYMEEKQILGIGFLICI